MFSLYMGAQYFIFSWSYSMCSASYLFIYFLHKDVLLSYYEIALNLFSSPIIFPRWH